VAIIDITEKTKVSFSWTVLTALISSLVVLCVAAYGARDGVLATTRTERTEILRAYVTHEEFLNWQIQESEKRDHQFRALLGKLDQIKGR
jgi:hypothetical protein